MRKICGLSLVLASFLMANSSSEIYEKALEYELNGEYKKAMMEYKKLADLAIKNEKSLESFKESSQKGDALARSENFDSVTQNSKSSGFDKSTQITLKSTPETTTQSVVLATKSKKPLYYKASDDGTLHIKEPIYAGYAYDLSDKADRKNDEVKFRVGFELPLVDDLFGLDETISFAYTQTSFWQVRQDSAPFRTTDYEPEIYATIPTDFWGLDYLRVGINHQSNGEDGVESRSWNRAYLETSFALGDLRVTPRVWHSFGLDDYNENIRQYLGYGDIKFNYDIGEHHLSALWRNNLRFDDENRGALELNYYFPLFDSGLHGFVQYFTGYGESLEDYDKHVDKFMLGIAVYSDR